MSSPNEMMDELARAEVGRPGSPFSFVSVGQKVRAVFTTRADLPRAVEVARKLADIESGQIVVEDKTGVVWDSREDR
jgi:hypothetical protein